MESMTTHTSCLPAFQKLEYGNLSPVTLRRYYRHLRIYGSPVIRYRSSCNPPRTLANGFSAFIVCCVVFPLRVYLSMLRKEGSGCRAQASGFGVQGLRIGFRASSCGGTQISEFSVLGTKIHDPMPMVTWDPLFVCRPLQTIREDTI